MSSANRKPRADNRRTAHHASEEAAAETKRQRALTLKVEGRSYREIGRELGVSHTQAERYVAESLEAQRESNKDLVSTLRDLEDERLDIGLRNILPLLLTPELLIVKTLADGHEVREDAAELRLKAVDRLLKLSHRRSELHGLDAPKRTELTGADGQPLLPALSPEVSAALETGYNEIVEHGRSPSTH